MGSLDHIFSGHWGDPITDLGISDRGVSDAYRTEVGIYDSVIVLAWVGGRVIEQD